MTFKKLALVSAIAIAPMASFAVESLDDATLSATTGQDGISIGLDLAVTTNTIVHDKDGFTTPTGTYTSDGAIVITGMSVAANGVQVTIDAGDSDVTTSHTAPVLNVNVNLTGGVTLQTGSIAVANSNRDDGTWGVATGAVTVMNNMTVSVGATALNIQLGNEEQGAMIRVDANITGGLTIGGMGITDAGGAISGGTLGSTSMTMVDAGGTDLNVDADIDISAAGLVISINELGTLVGGMDVHIVDQYIGNAASIIGDIEMQGLNLAGTQITISGN